MPLPPPTEIGLIYICFVDCTLVGKGACRGDGWSDGQWPLGAGVQSLDDCAEECQENQVGLLNYCRDKRGR